MCMPVLTSRCVWLCVCVIGRMVFLFGCECGSLWLKLCGCVCNWLCVVQCGSVYTCTHVHVWLWVCIQSSRLDFNSSRRVYIPVIELSPETKAP